ncbi:DUF4386 domain-containing protein [Salmonirosea aquatica]|uniref:DUF4386 family protein n=1 Tax=Salmonirosea aquatica TaxID=2654236 RepID=A0A7C9FZP2_9BACT|nr:DUF4386 family protein [Cytophagaceae bacterium SJW1-29]
MNKHTSTAWEPSRKLGRIAGVLYLIIVICGFLGIMYAPSQVMVRGDAPATMHNLLNHEFLFRAGMASQLLSSVVFILLVLALYRIFRGIHARRAQLMVVLVLVQIPLVFLGEGFHLAALMTAKGELMPSLALIQRQETVYLFLRIYTYGSIILPMVFWGLWLIPFGQLVIQSGYLPKILGIWLILGGVAYVIEVIDYLLLAERLSFVTDYFFVFHSVAELGTMAWLLAKGIQVKERSHS